MKSKSTTFVKSKNFDELFFVTKDKKEVTYKNGAETFFFSQSVLNLLKKLKSFLLMFLLSSHFPLHLKKSTPVNANIDSFEGTFWLSLKYDLPLLSKYKSIEFGYDKFTLVLMIYRYFQFTF